MKIIKIFLKNCCCIRNWAELSFSVSCPQSAINAAGVKVLKIVVNIWL